MVRRTGYIVLIGLLISGLLMFNGCRRHGPGKGAEFAVDYMTEVLDLTPDQQELLDQYKDEILAKAMQMRADKQEMHAVIKTQLGNETIDKAQVKQLYITHRDKMDEMADLIIDRVAAFHQTLTPEQRTKLIEKLEDFEKWHHRGWE